RIWRIAREAGFDDIRLLAFNGAPAPMTLDEFDDFLDGGPQLQVAARALRDFTANVRTFTLRRSGVEKTDSRVAAGLSAEIEVTLDGARFTAKITNTGTAEWLPSSATPGGVSLGAHLHRDGKLVDFNFLWAELGERTVKPNETVIVYGTIPALPAGRVTLEFDCVARSVAWFAQTGSRPTRVEIDARPV
ncbi:MAG TPA: hypothetical protein VHK90_08905, partial [Thermoanaerobaculia bacterium]|nr:hypothetical protein [Thermoanaerobaculia bacterium]